MIDVDTRSIVEYRLAELSLLPKERRTQWMKNINNLMEANTAHEYNTKLSRTREGRCPEPTWHVTTLLIMNYY